MLHMTIEYSTMIRHSHTCRIVLAILQRHPDTPKIGPRSYPSQFQSPLLDLAAVNVRPLRARRSRAV